MLWRTALPLLGCCACVSTGGVAARGHYQTPERPAAPEPAPLLVSAHLSRFGVEPAPMSETGAARMVEGSEASEDRLVLVFAHELDPTTIDPRALAILRADGRRVRPTRAFLAPADEGDENRSLTLTGNFGSEGATPVAVHVIGRLYAETGEDLQGLDADISGPSEPDRPVVVEQLEPGPRRCPDARGVVRSYWTDTLTGVGDDDLAGIELRLADGRTLAPSGFDDQAQREGEGEGEALDAGRADDNVLDLCVDADVAVVHVRFAAGLFADPGGVPSAAADVDLSPNPGPVP
ncbi:hypothetical protein ENSA5_43270 [Enhygromyxa salina]|uniref:Lipoprotein n=1 Tax=Enhygromyxa salina TaxID=215803 RepID=A0A2S9XKB9_9BACT|nr:hypothetical protein ENSA5_43270 [Enhygromyxa salina]